MNISGSFLKSNKHIKQNKQFIVRVQRINIADWSSAILKKNSAVYLSFLSSSGRRVLAMAITLVIYDQKI